MEAPKPEKITLKKPKEIEKVKEAAQDGPKLKPIPAKEKAEEEAKEGPKLKPIPQKPKPDEVCIISFQSIFSSGQGVRSIGSDAAC